MTKSRIFEEIVQIMKKDSATCRNFSGASPNPYLKLIHEDMTEKEFIFFVNSYLKSFGVPGHLFFKKQGTARPKIP